MRRKRKKTAYKQIMLSLIVLTVFIIGMASVISYQMFDRFYTNELAENDRRIMEYEVKTFSSDVLTRVRSLLSDLSFNDNNGTILGVFCQSHRFSSSAIYAAYKALKTTNTMYSPMMASAFVYYETQDMLISSNMGYKSINDASNNQYAAFISSLPTLSAQGVTFWSLPESGLAALESSPIAMGTRASWSDIPGASHACMVIAIKESFLRNALDRMTAEGSSAFLIDDSGAVLASSTYPMNVFDADGQTARQVLAGADYQSLTLGKNIFTRASLTGTPWHLVLVTPISAHVGHSREIARVVLIMASSTLLVGVLVMIIISRRLYSPIEELSAAIEALPTKLPESASGEYAVLRSAIGTLYTRLSDAERLLQVNKPLIRNMLVGNLISGMTSSTNAHDKGLLYAGIELPYGNYCVLEMELNGRQVSLLPAQQAQILHFTICDELEKRAFQPDMRLYSCINNQIIYILVNAAVPNDACLDDITMAVASLMGMKGIDWALARGSWQESLDQLPISRMEAAKALSARFYLKEGEHVIVPKNETIAVLPPALTALEDRFASCVSEGRYADAVAYAQQLSVLWENLPQAVCARSLAKLGEAIMLGCAESGMDLKPLVQPQDALWSIREYVPLVREILLAQPARKHAVQERADQIVQMTRSYIEAHLTDDLSLESIASSMHFNAKYFSRMFKELSGMQLSDFINSLRLERAAAYLTDTPLSVERIASMTGYNSPQYFIRKFKNAYGMTPREYRLCPRRAEEAHNESD